MNQNIFASETLFSAAYLNIEQTTDISRHYLRFSLHGRTVHLVLLLGLLRKPDGVSREASNPV